MKDYIYTEKDFYKVDLKHDKLYLFDDDHRKLEKIIHLYLELKMFIFYAK